MQIFFLSSDPRVAAQMLADQHICSSIKEVFQILSTVWAIHNPEDYEKYHSEELLLLRWRHNTHPSIRWAGASVSNYWWTCEFLFACLDEFVYRRNKQHIYHQRMEQFLKLGSPNLPDIGFVTMSKTYQAITDQGLKDENPVISYRRYYIVEKSRFAKWNWGREMPEWYRRNDEFHGFKWISALV